MSPKEFLKANMTVTVKTDKNGNKTVIRKPSATAVKEAKTTEADFSKAISKAKEYIYNNNKELEGTTGYGFQYLSYPQINRILVDALKDTDLTVFQSAKFVKTYAKGGCLTQYCPCTVLQYKWDTKVVGLVPKRKGVMHNGKRKNTPSQAFGGALTSSERQSLMMVFGLGVKNDGYNDSDNGSSNSSNGGF